MQFFVGQVLSVDVFGTEAFQLPPGSVVMPDDGSHPRVLADWTQNDGFVFTDKSGFYGVNRFTIVHLPEVDELSEVDQLAEELKDIFMNTAVSAEEPVDRFRLMAEHVLDNYERIPENDDLPLEVIDVDGDTWLMSGGTYKCVGDPECDNLDLTLLEEFYGPLEIVA